MSNHRPPTSALRPPISDLRPPTSALRPPASGTPLFSIVTVTLNPGEDLPKTVDSVLMQDFDDWELVIKDGGSTDGTEGLQWQDTRIQRHSSPDSGIFDAMNQALELATGDYVCFLNAGDLFYDKTVLSTVADSIRDNPDVPFFCGDVRKLQSRSGFELYPERLSRYFLFTHMICHQAWFVTRDTYRQYGGFETDYATGGDYRLYLKMLARDKMPYKHVETVIASYKGDGASTHPENAFKSQEWRRQLKREIFALWETALYGGIWASRNAIKRLIYDTIIWRILRWRRLHLQNNERAS